MRRLVVLGMSLALSTGTPAAGAATAPSPGASTAPAPTSSAPTQTFTGGGSGQFTASLPETANFAGRFTSNGELGDGRFVMGFSTHPQASVDFIRSDSTVLRGVMTKTPSSDCGSTDPAAAGCLRADLVGTADIVSARIFVFVVIPAVTPSRPLSLSFLMRGTLTLQQPARLRHGRRERGDVHVRRHQRPRRRADHDRHRPRADPLARGLPGSSTRRDRCSRSATPAISGMPTRPRSPPVRSS